MLVPRFSADLTALFTDLPLLERFAAAKDAGFDGRRANRTAR